MEFVVDGQRLGHLLEPFLGYDAVEEYVPVLVTDWPTGVALDDVGRLLTGGQTQTLDGRTAIYLCAECGDLGCGGITAVVEVRDRTVVWRDFGYQNDYEPFEATDIYDGLGPFEFDRDQYNAELQRFLALATAQLPGLSDD